MMCDVVAYRTTVLPEMGATMPVARLLRRNVVDITMWAHGGRCVLQRNMWRNGS